MQPSKPSNCMAVPEAAAAATAFLLLHAQLICSSIAAAGANTGLPYAFYDTPHLGQNQKVFCKHHQTYSCTSYTNNAMGVSTEYCCNIAASPFLIEGM